MKSAAEFMKRAFDVMNALNGAAAGGTIGSFVPGPGTAVGAIGGGLVGGLLGGGGAAKPKPKPALVQSGNMLRGPAPSVLGSAMTHYASLTEEQRNAYDWGIDLFAKKAGLDLEDRDALHFLLKSAAPDDQYSEQFRSIGIKKPFQFNPYGGGGYVAGNSGSSTPVSGGMKPLQNQFDAGAAPDGAGTTGGTLFRVGQGLKAYGKALVSPIKTISEGASSIGQDYVNAADANAKFKREGAINKAVDDKVLGSGFLQERARTDRAKINDQFEATAGRRQAFNKEVGRTNKLMRDESFSNMRDAQGMAPEAAAQLSAGGNPNEVQRMLGQTPPSVTGTSPMDPGAPQAPAAPAPAPASTVAAMPPPPASNPMPAPGNPNAQ